jgi:hypothetical protein
LYFLSSSCVLPRVTGRTSLILRIILSFLQPFREDSALAKVQHMYFPVTLCVHPIFTVCTFLCASSCLEKIKFLYFLGYVFRTSFLFFFILPDGVSRSFSKTMVTLLYGVLLVPPSQYCTSLCYHVVLSSVIMLYFPPSQYCTSLRYYVVFSIMIHFLCKITRGRILL